MMFAQVGGGATGRPGGAEPTDKVVDAVDARGGEVVMDLAAGAVVMGLHVLVVGVLGRMVERAGSLRHHRFDDRIDVVGCGRIGAFGQSGQFHNLGAQQAKQIPHLVDLDAVRHRPQPDTVHRAEQPQRLGGIAARRFDECLPPVGEAGQLVPDHRPRDPVLDRAERVVRLEFRVQLHAVEPVHRGIQAQQGSVADEFGDVVVEHHRTSDSPAAAPARRAASSRTRNPAPSRVTAILAAGGCIDAVAADRSMW